MPGTPILLLHGALDAADLWHSVAEALRAAGREAILPSVTPAGSPVEHAEALVADLPVGGAHLVGHGLGGTAASWLAVERPERVRSLAVVASPPQASEVLRADFRRRLAAARDADRSALEHLATLPDDDFPQHALRRYRGRALVVEYEDDPLYSPTHTMFWRMFLPYADFERVPGGHRALAEDESAAAWLARRVAGHVEAAERGHVPGEGSP